MNWTVQISRSDLAGFSTTAAFALSALPATALAGMAEVQTFLDKEEWIAAIGGDEVFATIDFTGFPPATFITDQYEDLGVTFTDGDDETTGFEPDNFPNDGFGLAGNGPITFELSSPQTFFAVDFPSPFIGISLYLGDELVFSEADIIVEPPPNFGGFISSLPFDRVVLAELPGQVFLDDLYVPVIPAPPVWLCVIGCGFLFHSRRRARQF